MQRKVKLERLPSNNDMFSFAGIRSPTKTFGSKSLTLNIGLLRNFTWDFKISAISQPILGTDFLRHLNILVSIQQCKLFDGKLPVLRFSTINTNDEFQKLLKLYP